MVYRLFGFMRFTLNYRCEKLSIKNVKVVNTMKVLKGVEVNFAISYIVQNSLSLGFPYLWADSLYHILAVP